jgi:hypothetical protein
MAIPPRTLNFSLIYTTPRAEYFATHAKLVNTLIKDWEVSFFGNYQSDPFLAIPGTPNTEFTQDIYTKGVRLYLNPKTGAPNNTSPLNGSFNPWTDVFAESRRLDGMPVNTNCGDSGNDFLKTSVAGGIRRRTQISAATSESRKEWISRFAANSSKS